MIRLAALGALGYAGYKYYQKKSNQFGRGNSAERQNMVAGEPLSYKATVNSTAGNFGAQ